MTAEDNQNVTNPNINNRDLQIPTQLQHYNSHRNNHQQSQILFNQNENEGGFSQQQVQQLPQEHNDEVQSSVQINQQN